MKPHLVVALLAASTGGCGSSFIADAGVDAGPDTGTDGGPPDLGHDTGPPDFGVRDLGTYDGPEDCSEIAGYRRCDERCPQPCEVPSRCLSEIGLCVIRPPEGFQGCDFVALTTEPRGSIGYCSRSGGPCLVYWGDGSTEQHWIGHCLGAEVCLAADGQGLPSFTCRYSDGSVVVTGPPDTPCPPSADGAPFCGGSCGMAPEGCPDTHLSSFTITALPCIGMSDTRAHGVCVYLSADCGRSSPTLLRNTLSACRDNYGAPCACMQLAAGPDGPLSYPVKADACVRYRAEYPDSVECLDATLTPLP